MRHGENRLLKVLATPIDQSDSLASLLRAAFPGTELTLLDGDHIEPADRSAELLLARYFDDADGLLVRKLISQINSQTLDLPVVLLQAEPNADRLAEGLRPAPPTWSCWAMTATSCRSSAGYARSGNCGTSAISGAAATPSRSGAANA